MRLIKVVLIVTLLVAVINRPSLVGEFASATKSALTGRDDPSEATSTQARVCPLIAVWRQADTTGQQAAARQIRRVTRREADRVTDPAAKALLHSAPLAVGGATGAEHRFADRLVAGQCRQFRGTR